MRKSIILMCGLAMSVVACKKEAPTEDQPVAFAPAPAIQDCNFPSFTLAYSEYTSWSTFAVAEMDELVGAAKGKCGPFERRHGVDIVFQFMGYDPSIGAYAGGTVDAVTITNMDMLVAARADATVAVFATSNSWGADRTIVTKDITTLDQLAGVPCRGLEATVSQYVFEETLRAAGKNPTKYPYQMMQPDAASAAMIARDPAVKCIAVWEPFALNTLKSRDDVHVLADSRAIPTEVLDLIVVGQNALDRPKGTAFVEALLDTYYGVVAQLDDPKYSDDAHRRLGKKVTDLDAAAMRDTLTRSLLYKNPQGVSNLLENRDPYPFPDDNLKGMRLKDSTAKAIAWMLAHKAIQKAPTVGYGSKAQAPNVNFRFDPTYVQTYIASSGATAADHLK